LRETRAQARKGPSKTGEEEKKERKGKKRSPMATLVVSDKGPKKHETEKKRANDSETLFGAQGSPRVPAHVCESRSHLAA
jgi:hypothetical protein